MSKLSMAARGLALALTVELLAPLGAAAAPQDARLHEVNPNVGFASVSRAYEDMDARYVRVGTRRDIDQVLSVAMGQSKAEVQAHLGRPALGYKDGSAEYHLNLPLTGSNRLICQYRVFFNSDNKVERAVWRRPQCADLVLGRLN